MVKLLRVSFASGIIVLAACSPAGNSLHPAVNRAPQSEGSRDGVLLAVRHVPVGGTHEAQMLLSRLIERPQQQVELAELVVRTDDGAMLAVVQPVIQPGRNELSTGQRVRVRGGLHASVMGADAAGP